MRQPMKMAWRRQEFKSNIERFVRHIENCVWNGRIDVCRMGAGMELSGTRFFGGACDTVPNAFYTVPTPTADDGGIMPEGAV